MDVVTAAEVDGVLPSNELVGRIPFVDVDPRVRAAWRLVLSHVRVLRRGRRDSESDRSPLLERLAESHEECYGPKDAASTPYEEFVAERVKELPGGSPVVRLVDCLPPLVAETIANLEQMLRPLTAEEEGVFRDLNRRYSHAGGPPGEWEKYLNSDEAAEFWEMMFEEDVVANTAVLAVGRRKDLLLRKILAQVPGNFLLFSPEELLPPEFCNLGMLGGTALSRTKARQSRPVE